MLARLKKLGMICRVGLFVIPLMTLCYEVYLYQNRSSLFMTYSTFDEVKNTPPGPNTLLVYNRVPKAGSGTMLALLLELQKKNNFKLQVGRLSHRFMTRGQEMEAVGILNNITKPGCQIGHFYYINYTRLGEATPLYMNVIRDPVERVISSFFYKHIKEDAGPLQYDDDAINDITNRFMDCFNRREIACSYIPGAEEIKGKLSIPYFCGSDSFCFIHGSKTALKRALYAIEKSYTVVGIIEEFDKTLTVLENYLPYYFRGVKTINTNDSRKHAVHRDNVEDKFKKIKDELRKNMTIEYELYNFVKQRLNNQYESILDQSNGTSTNNTTTKLKDEDKNVNS